MPSYIEMIPGTLYRSRNQGSFRIIVIGNAQVRYLAPLIELIIVDCACDYAFSDGPVRTGLTPNLANLLEAQRDEYALVLAHSHPAGGSHLPNSALTELFGKEKTLFILNLHHYGLYPDIISLETEMWGAMGPFHSRMAIGGWLAGLSGKEVARLYNAESIAKAGYAAFFEIAKRHLREAEADCDTSFAEDILRLSERAFCFYSFNRPTPVLLVSFVAHIGDLLRRRDGIRLTGVALNAMLPSETMAFNGTWPIYPELKELLGIDFPVSANFILPDRGLGAKVVSREAFVRKSIDLYEKIGRDALAKLKEASYSRQLVQRLL